jgi:hypothetical protein
MKYTIKSFEVGKYDCDTMFLEDEEKVEYQVCIAKGLEKDSLINTQVEILNIYDGVIEEL